MVTKCANPSCSTSFQYFRGGKLFLLRLPRYLPASEGEAVSARRLVEYFWLCDVCCAELTVVVNREGQPTVAKAQAK